MARQVEIWRSPGLPNLRIRAIHRNLTLVDDGWTQRVHWDNIDPLAPPPAPTSHHNTPPSSLTRRTWSPTGLCQREWVGLDLKVLLVGAREEKKAMIEELNKLAA